MKIVDAKAVSGFLAALDEVRGWQRLFREKIGDEYAFVRIEEIMMVADAASDRQHSFHGQFSVPRKMAEDWFADLEAKIVATLRSFDIEVTP